MIRLIQNRLIIPRGDTGSFTILNLKESHATDVAVFSIFDERTRKVIFSKYVEFVEDNMLKITFSHADTVNLNPGRYVWDIKVYSNPLFVDGILIGGDEIDSYYAGFSLPTCEIKESVDTYLCGCDKHNNTLFPDKINLINEALKEAQFYAGKAKDSAEHYPIIQNSYWYVWNPLKEGYINTNIKANGDSVVVSVEVINEETLKVIFSDNTYQIIHLSGLDSLILDNDLIYDAGNIDNGLEPEEDSILDAGSLEE